jgi:hypothetical protein
MMAASTRIFEEQQGQIIGLSQLRASAPAVQGLPP